jgi:hypothetical protein
MVVRGNFLAVISRVETKTRASLSVYACEQRYEEPAANENVNENAGMLVGVPVSSSDAFISTGFCVRYGRLT